MTEIVAVGSEIAMPFVSAACRRYEVPFDAESGTGVVWWAGHQWGSIRAIAGWAEIDGCDIALFGPFGDGSRFDDVWINEMLAAHHYSGVKFIVIPASPSLFVRRQSAQLERYGTVRTPHVGIA